MDPKIPAFIGKDTMTPKIVSCHVCSARGLQNAGESLGEPRRGACGGAPRLDLWTRATSLPRWPSDRGAATNGHGRAGCPTCTSLVHDRCPCGFSPSSPLTRRQPASGGPLDLALSFSTCAISSSSVAHPCRYRQSISKVRSVGLPPVQRWISRQAMIAQYAWTWMATGRVLRRWRHPRTCLKKRKKISIVQRYL